MQQVKHVVVVVPTTLDAAFPRAAKQIDNLVKELNKGYDELTKFQADGAVGK